MRTLLLALLASLSITAQAAEVRVKVEFSGGQRTAQLHWDPVIRIENGKLNSLENAGLDTKDEVWSAKTDTSVRIKAMTEGGADGVILVLEAEPATKIVFESAVLSFTATVGEITRGQVEATGANNTLLTMALAPTSFAQVPAMECATALPAGDGSVWTLGVRNNGDAKLAATRQELVLGKVTDGKWAERQIVEPAGYVYFATMVGLPDGNLLLAWCRFEQETWQVYAATFSDGKLSAPVKLSDGAVNLIPALYAGPEGVWCAWQADSGKQFAIRARQLNGQSWGKTVAIDTAGSSARPQMAGDGQRVWLAFDQFVGRDFDVYACRLEADRATAPQPVIATDVEEMSPRVANGDGVVWLTAANQVVGLAGDELVRPVAMDRQQPKPPTPLTDLLRDERGTLWLISARPGGRNAAASFRMFPIRGDQLQPGPNLTIGPTWATPLLDRDGTLLALDGARLNQATVNGPANPLAPVTQPIERPEKPIRVGVLPPLKPLQLNGQTYQLYYGELHTHLGENPDDVTIRNWVDRFYLRARHDQGLSIGAVSDHDWPAMTITKFVVQQAIVKVLNDPGNFVAYSGFEWSGSGPVRKAYGDRTVVFANDYTPIARITDEVGDQPAKLHDTLRKYGGIDWPHHVGSSWAIMDWSSLETDVEPVVEITSNHGVYETYDPARAIAGWTKTPIADRTAPIGPNDLQAGKTEIRPAIGQNDRTSLQYGLSTGKQFAFVGSSDSHSGISGYETGMLGVYAKELTRESVIEAWQAKRVFAVRGGQRIGLDYRIGDTFMGGETKADQPRLKVTVEGTAPITRVEVVRNNEYVYTQDGNGSATLSFDYLDAKPPAGKSYYYLRVFQEGDVWAWASPIWVERG